MFSERTLLRQLFGEARRISHELKRIADILSGDLGEESKELGSHVGQQYKAPGDCECSPYLEGISEKQGWMEGLGPTAIGVSNQGTDLPGPASYHATEWFKQAEGKLYRWYRSSENCEGHWIQVRGNLDVGTFDIWISS